MNGIKNKIGGIENLDKILIIGPFPPPITGNTLANKVIYNELLKRGLDVDSLNLSYGTFLEKRNTKKILLSLKRYLRCYKILRYQYIYLTPGQSFAGLMKYAPFILLSKALGKKVIVHIHGDYVWQEYESLKGLKRVLYKYVFSLSDKGIVLSETLKRNLSPFIDKNRIFVLPNFVEDYLFDIEIEDKDFSYLRIIYLSNLMKDKGILDLLKALLLLKEKGIPFEAKLAGNIREEEKIIINDYLNKLIPEVKYMGVVLGHKKKELLKWGNVFVLPTYYRIEGQPISILEAMATGNIILTTNHAGIPDIFKNGINGFYIEKKNPKDIAAKLEQISENLIKYRTISLTNMKEAKRKYRISVFINNFIRILRA